VLCTPGDIVTLDSADGQSAVNALTWVRTDTCDDRGTVMGVALRACARRLQDNDLMMCVVGRCGCPRLPLSLLVWLPLQAAAYLRQTFKVKPSLTGVTVKAATQSGFTDRSADDVNVPADVVVIVSLRPIAQISTSAFAVSGPWPWVTCLVSVTMTMTTQTISPPLPVPFHPFFRYYVSCFAPSPSIAWSHPNANTTRPPSVTVACLTCNFQIHVDSVSRCVCNGTSTGGAQWATSTGIPASWATRTTPPPRRCGKQRSMR
jgi:hypothetical protein